MCTCLSRSWGATKNNKATDHERAALHRKQIMLPFGPPPPPPPPPPSLLATPSLTAARSRRASRKALVCSCALCRSVATMCWQCFCRWLFAGGLPLLLPSVCLSHCSVCVCVGGRGARVLLRKRAVGRKNRGQERGRGMQPVYGPDNSSPFTALLDVLDEIQDAC